MCVTWSKSHTAPLLNFGGLQLSVPPCWWQVAMLISSCKSWQHKTKTTKTLTTPETQQPAVQPGCSPCWTTQHVHDSRAPKNTKNHWWIEEAICNLYSMALQTTPQKVQALLAAVLIWCNFLFLSADIFNCVQTNMDKYKCKMPNIEQLRERWLERKD